MRDLPAARVCCMVVQPICGGGRGGWSRGDAPAGGPVCGRTHAQRRRRTPAP